MKYVHLKNCLQYTGARWRRKSDVNVWKRGWAVKTDWPWTGLRKDGLIKQELIKHWVIKHGLIKQGLIKIRIAVTKHSLRTQTYFRSLLSPPDFSGGTLRDDTKNGCVTDYCLCNRLFSMNLGQSKVAWITGWTVVSWVCQQSQGGQSSESLLFRCFPIRLSRCLEQANVSRDLADVVFSHLYEKPENTYAALGQSLFLVSMLSQFLFQDPCTSRVICTVFKQLFFFFHYYYY